MMKIIRFDRRPWRDSKGRNGFMFTTGVEILFQDAAPGDDLDGAVLMYPITSRGETSEACRLSIAKSALPDVIAALQEIANG
jgi:hypothetical protein